MGKKSSHGLSYIFMLLGILIMLVGSVSTYIPTLSEVGFDGVTVSGIPAFSATLIFIGIVILLVGVGVYFKDK